jgi:hypothetical protein
MAVLDGAMVTFVSVNELKMAHDIDSSAEQFRYADHLLHNGQKYQHS